MHRHFLHHFAGYQGVAGWRLVLEAISPTSTPLLVLSSALLFGSVKE